jgi:integrase
VPKTYTGPELAKLTKDGEYRIGPNCFLQIKGPSRSWLFRYRRHGRLHRMGLGNAGDYTATEARRKATAARKQLDDGIDPLRARRAERRALTASGASPTFETVALELIDVRKSGWRDKRRPEQWKSSLRTHAKAIWQMPVAEVVLDDVLACCKPIWTKQAETAGRVRSRVKAVLDYAMAKGYREHGPNPADIYGPLGKLLPQVSRTERTEHHESVPYQALPKLYLRIMAVGSAASRLLALTILTAVRSGEARLARWREFDLQAKMWSIPAERTKTGQPHLVPLTDEAMALLGEVRKPDRLVFAGVLSPSKPMSDATTLKALRKLTGGKETIHGMRAAFKTWASEQTDFPWEISEAALGHQVGTEVERAYARTTFFDKRVELMKAWSAYLSPGRGAPVP